MEFRESAKRDLEETISEIASILGEGCPDAASWIEEHPIRAGEVIGTHNGTIYNADYLFRRWKLRRFAEVDSEILFRLAANAARDGVMDIERFKAQLRRCRGQITAVIACRSDPQTVIVLKGNRPLELRWHPRRKAVLFA